MISRLGRLSSGLKKENLKSKVKCAWANPSSSHALGLGARCQLEAARRDLAHSIGTKGQTPFLYTHTENLIFSKFI